MERSGAKNCNLPVKRQGSKSNRMNIACLLLHGFTGTPFEMEPLGQALENVGINVHIPVLPGHGTTIEKMDSTRFEDWYTAARNAYLGLRNSADKVFICGLSMGGSLTLRLAEEYDPDGIALLAAPVFLYRLFPPAMADWRLPFVPLLRLFRPIWPVKASGGRSREIQPWKGYDTAMPLNALGDFMASLPKIRARLAKISCPILMLQDARDRTVHRDNALEIHQKVSSLDKTLHILHIKENTTSRHVLTTHQETRDIVQHYVLQFIAGLVPVSTGTKGSTDALS